MIKLYESDVDRISFSLYDGDDQYKEFESIRNRLGLTEEKMLLRRQYYDDGNFGMTIFNRVDLVNLNRFRIEGNDLIEIDRLPMKSRAIILFLSYYRLIVVR